MTRSNTSAWEPDGYAEGRASLVTRHAHLGRDRRSGGDLTPYGEGEAKVIECNLRAACSFPFVSKTLGINFIREAMRRMLGAPHAAIQTPNLLKLGRVGVKVPQFSFSRIKGVDPRSGVEMASTGEVACFGRDADEALAKAMLATGYRIPLTGHSRSLAVRSNSRASRL